VVFGPASIVEEMIKPDTRAIHMWNGRLFGLTEKPPPQGSYLDVICRRHGVETNRSVSR
jgi:hypothetical protein